MHVGSDLTSVLYPQDETPALAFGVPVGALQAITPELSGRLRDPSEHHRFWEKGFEGSKHIFDQPVR